jgi:hypothetical protein
MRGVARVVVARDSRPQYSDERPVAGEGFHPTEWEEKFYGPSAQLWCSQDDAAALAAVSGDRRLAAFIAPLIQLHLDRAAKSADTDPAAISAATFLRRLADILNPPRRGQPSELDSRRVEALFNDLFALNLERSQRYADSPSPPPAKFSPVLDLVDERITLVDGTWPRRAALESLAVFIDESPDVVEGHLKRARKAGK